MDELRYVGRMRLWLHWQRPRYYRGGTLRPVASSEGGGLFSRLRANEGGRGREAPEGGSVIAATGDVVVARWQLLSLPNPHDLIWQDGDRPYSLMASSSGTH